MTSCFGHSKTVNQNLRLGLSITFAFFLVVLTACFAILTTWARWFHVVIYVLGIFGLFNIFTGTIYYIGTAKMKTPYIDDWNDSTKNINDLKISFNTTKTCRRNVYVMAVILSLIVIIPLLTLTQLKSIPV